MAEREEMAGAADAEGSACAGPRLWQFCHLPFGYQVLVWAARTWLRDANAPAIRCATIRQAFAKINAEDATVPFLRLMSVMHTGARVPILIGEGGCAVFPDEIRLAEVLARAAEGDPDSGRRHLDRLLSPAAARVAAALAGEVGASLRGAGLRFPRISQTSATARYEGVLH